MFLTKSHRSLALILSFFIFSMLLNSMGIIILQNSHVTKYSNLGILEFFKDLPIALVSILSVNYIKKYGYRNSLLFSLILVAICCFSLVFVDGFWFYKIWFAIIGVSFAIAKIAVFSLTKILTTDFDFTKIMNRIEASFMLGIFVVNVGFAILLESIYKDYWKFGFWVIAFLAIINCLLLIKLKDGVYNNDENAEPKTNSSSEGIFSPFTLLFLIIIFLIVFVEQSFNSWLPTFYKKTLKASSFFALQSSAFLALFSFIGRLFTSKIINRISWKKYISFCIISVLLLLIFAQIYHQFIHLKFNLLIFIFPLIGLFLSPLYPVINSQLIIKNKEKITGKLVSFIGLFTSFGSSLGSFSMAFVFQKNLGNYYLLFAALPVVLLLIIVSILFSKDKNLV